MTSRRCLICGQFAALVLMAGPLAWGQITPPRIRFPSSGVAPPAVTAQPPVITQPPTTTVPPSVNFGQPAVTIPSTPPPFSSTPGFTTTPPPVTLDGTITPSIPAAPSIPATPGFDPYADPIGSSGTFVQPGAAAPLGTSPAIGGPCAPGVVCDPPMVQQATFGQWPRFVQQVRLRHTWLNRSGGGGLGWNTSELSATLLFPFLFNQNAPLLVTPGFAAHFTDGPAGFVGFDPPDTTPLPLNTGANLPPRLYDAFVDFAWTPQITYGLSADVGFRVGIYSDFGKIDQDSLRYQGRGYGVWRTSETHEWRAGVIYVDRVDIKILPAGGLIWTPGGPAGNSRWEILFPNPKFAFRLSTWRNTDLWWYVAGEYGGGSWQADRGIVNLDTGVRSTFTDRFDYNDIRIILGVETHSHYGIKALFEVGYVLDRKIDFVSNAFDFSPKDTFMLRGGLTY